MFLLKLDEISNYFFVYLLLIQGNKRGTLLIVAKTNATSTENKTTGIKKVVDFNCERWYIN
ncbi:hypothetical protein GCM10007063_24500 [Lentibacillus kapialis]|uniref:Uncharacterized protein n=1 Tax=Lentibacillus kapialis TaxID=340214 RepID=A0A917UZU3_9BACI|nr:hypothetical protein GCM10007063_24500 [Lentibacillus kapialis]